MGYFDGITNAAFKIDDQGRRLFFLYGKFGKGRLLPTEADEQLMRKKYKTFYMYTLFFVVPVVVLTNLLSHQGWTLKLFMIQLLIGAILLAPAYIWMEIEARKFAKVDARLTFAESYANSAAGHNYFSLIALLVVSGVFVLGGLLMAIYAPSGDRWIGMIGVIFFGACGAVIGWMLRLKIKQGRMTKIN